MRQGQSTTVQATLHLLRRQKFCHSIGTQQKRLVNLSNRMDQHLWRSNYSDVFSHCVADASGKSCAAAGDEAAVMRLQWWRQG